MFQIPSDEHERLAALAELDVLDTQPEQLYDDVVRLAATICDTPIAAINFIDAERQWGKALVGLESSEGPRETSFCAQTILQQDAVLVIHDTLEDPVWAENPMVIGYPGVRFYAGTAIVTEDGHALGALCVADNRGPRELDAGALQALRILARQTAAHLKLRKRSAQLIQANEELRHMSVSDGLTGLANRTLLESSLALALRQRRRSGRTLGLLFCDMDGFKQVNDRLGHHAGDALLCAVADRLMGAARGSDLVARFAGDEFVVMCPELNGADDLGVVVRRVSDTVAQPVELAGVRVLPRVSIGSALARDTDGADDLLRRADTAMYAAKRNAKRVDAQEKTSKRVTTSI